MSVPTHVAVLIPDAATYTVDSRNAGVPHYLPNLTADIVISLPSPVAGLWFDFVYVGGAADAQDWLIDTGSNTNFYTGGLVHLTDGTPDIEAVYSDGNSNSKATVLTPEAGTRVKVESVDGVTWLISGQVVSASAPSFADQ